MNAIRASARHSRAIHATAELLGKLRIESIFVGSVARAAWLGDPIESGSIDVLALMNAPQKNQLATMASHRGYRVEREEIEQSEQLDLVPLNFIDQEGEVRVHVLLASNALYGRMVSGGELAVCSSQSAEAKPDAAASSPASRDLRSAISLRVARAEDLALMLLMAEDHEAVRRLTELPELDRAAFEERLVAIGLRSQVPSAQVARS
jgi:hypothetical protein